jgi:unsaturated chondroitin disaccharide hydrolase
MAAELSLDHVLTQVCERIARNSAIFGDRFPTVGQDTTYDLTINDTWLASFWPGLLWLAFAATGDEALKTAAQARLASFEDRLDQRVHITHDLGFLFTLSARAQWQLAGDDAARKLALRAADELAARFRPAGDYVQAWGRVGDPDEGGRTIIDTMMNIPLMFWSAAQTGDDRYHHMAARHAETTARYLVRDDGSSNHTYFFNQETGAPLGPRTHQGYADDSVWARGQGWAIYGFAVAAAWTGDARFRKVSRQAAACFLDLLPADGLPLWDLRMPDDAPRYPDSSAGAIAAAGLLRLARLLEGDPAAHMRQAADILLRNLIARYFDQRPEAQGLLGGGTYNVHKGWGINEYFIAGDYFFLEALLLHLDRCPDFWGPAR